MNGNAPSQLPVNTAKHKHAGTKKQRRFEKPLSEMTKWQLQ